MDRHTLLNDMKQYLRPCEFWEAWLAESGELPPDFDEMPAIPGLPDPLNFQGLQACNAQDWTSNRAAILASFQHFVIGTYPDAPGNVTAEVLNERTEPSGVSVQEVLLRFGPDHRARLHAQLSLPPGEGPFPVFVSQRNHEGWARIALARGYAAAIYNGCDSADDTQAFKDVWPEHDWSMLCRRAWAAGRVLDWLHTLPRIDKQHASISGHSRNGKLSLISGAIEPRFDVVISSSSGIGGAAPYRMANEAHFSEGIELLSFFYKEWFHPRLRFFAGHEHRLPVDANLLLALSAPRAVLVSAALNDPCGSLKAGQAAVRSASEVWKLLGRSQGLGLVLRPGGHETRPEEIERFVDWCELHWGRLDPQVAVNQAECFKPTYHYSYSFEDWKRHNAERFEVQDLPVPRTLLEQAPVSAEAWETGRDDRVRRIRGLLGEEPATASRAPSNYGVEPEYFVTLLHRPKVDGDTGLEAHSFSFGEHIPARIFLPEGTMADLERTGKKVPLAIWVHPESISSGYSGAYFKGRHPPAGTAIQGVAAMAFDLLGGGTRLPEMQKFHQRYPRWSILGKHVHDVLSAVEGARAIPWVDEQNIFLFGFGSGATAALFAAALDERVAGVAAVCGLSPFRSDTEDRPTGGLARFAQWEREGLLPKLGLFAGEVEKTSRVPIDFDEILASIAPRPLFCCAPKYDREVNHEDVLESFAAVKAAYESLGAAGAFECNETIDHRSFRKDSENFRSLHKWLLERAGLVKRESVRLD